MTSHERRLLLVERPRSKENRMAQLVQPQVHISPLRGHRLLVIAALGVLVTAAAALILVLARGSSDTATPVVPSPAAVRGADAGPSAGTPSAISQALAVGPVRAGSSLTTNLPALPRVEAGPVTGTPSAVSGALGGTEARF